MTLERLRLKCWRVKVLWDPRGKFFSTAMNFFHLAFSDYAFMGKKLRCLPNIYKKTQGTRRSEGEMT